MNKSLRNFLALALGMGAAAVGGIFAPSARAQGTSNAPLARSGEIVVKVPASMARTALEQLAASAGCRVDRAIPFSPGFYVFELNTTRSESPTAAPVSQAVTQAVDKLRGRPGTLADPNWVVTKRGVRALQQQGGPTTDPLYPNTKWHMDAINMPLAWSIQASVPGKRVLVAVSDTGLDVNHPDFQLPGGGTKFVNPINVTFDTPTTDVTDTQGHGTHVAGTVAAAAGNGIGVPSVAGYTGGGVDVRVVPIKIFPDEGQAPSAVDSSVAAINYSVQQNCDVHNMSWGGYSPPPTTLNAAIQTAAATGMVLVGASGNDGRNDLPPSQANGFVSWPDSFDNVIRVSSVGPSLTLANYSNYGWRTAIAGPGGQAPNFEDMVWSTIPLNVPSAAGVPGYDSYQGTSMASPHVAGVAALIVAAGAPRTSVRAILQATAKPLDEVPNLDPEGSSKYGAGLVDAYKALLQVVDPLPAVFLSGGMDKGASFDRTFPISFNVIGVNKLPQASIVVRVETATIPATVVRQYVMGTDFPMPTLAPGEVAATLKPVTIPIVPPLAQGRYKTVVSVTFNNQTTESVQFFEISEKRQPLGRSMFSIPFRAADVDPNPEKAVFGTGTSFILRRYSPLNPAGGAEAPGYFTFSSTGQPADVEASFRATHPGGAPIAFDVANPAASIAPVGLGYWLDLEDTRTLNLIGPKVDTTVGIKLSAANGGWNMVGAPFTAPVDWSGVSVELPAIVGTRRLPLAEAVDQGIISGVLVGYRDGEYVYNVTPSGQFEPFQGYWVRALQDCTLIIAPPSASLTRSRATAAGAGGPVMKGWRARIIASVAGDRDGQNFFGQVDGAKLQEDRFDIPKPPAGAGHAYVRFVADKADGRATALAYDMRSPGSGRQEWTVAVSTDRENADVTLSWDGISNAPRRSRLVLKDANSGQVIPMNSRSSFTFKGGEAGSTRLFKIVLEPSASGGPLQIMNVTSVNTTGSRGTTGGGALNVRFTVNQDAEVQATIRTMTGKPVANLTGASRATSMKETILRWDGRTRSGGSVAAGPYLLEITARTADGEVTTVKRPIQYLR